MLDFPYIKGRHTGRRIAKVLFAILKKFNIVDRLAAMTYDNASNNTTLYTAIYIFPPLLSLTLLTLSRLEAI